MYTITQLIRMAMHNTQTFRKVGKSWYAGVSESQFSLLDQQEGFCLDYLQSLGLLKDQESFYEIYTCTPELLKLNLKIGSVISYSSYNPYTQNYKSLPLKLQSGHKTYLLKKSA